LHDKDHIRIDEKKWNVYLNRTFWLDQAAERIRRRLVRFPQDVTRELIDHYQGLTRVVEQDEETGQKKAYYLKNDEDHLFHATAYNEVAACDWEGFTDDQGSDIREPLIPGEFRT
jgi:hypothetical protein